MMNPLIIKLGGVLLDSEEALERLFTALVNYRESHQRPLVIVHGGGCVVDELMKGLNLPVKKKDGLRVTPADQIGIITGALAGTANKTLLAWAKKHHIASVGLFLGDGDSVNVTQLDEALGHVGLAQPGSPKLINMLLENGFLPVVSSIGVTEDGQLMNVNADQAATALAATLGADLILLSDERYSGRQRPAYRRNDGVQSRAAYRPGHYYRRDDCESECGSRCCAGAGSPCGYRFLASCGATAGAV